MEQNTLSPEPVLKKKLHWGWKVFMVAAGFAVAVAALIAVGYFFGEDIHLDESGLFSTLEPTESPEKPRAGEKDCGLLTGVRSDTSVSCVREAFINCAPSVFTMRGTFDPDDSEETRIYRITGKSGENCILYNSLGLVTKDLYAEDPKDMFTTAPILCAIPLRMIEYMKANDYEPKPTDISLGNIFADSLMWAFGGEITKGEGTPFMELEEGIPFEGEEDLECYKVVSSESPNTTEAQTETQAEVSERTISLADLAELESLQEARRAGEDAQIKAYLSSMRARAELYWDSKSTNGKDGSYKGFCSDPESTKFLSEMRQVDNEAYVCNDNSASYAISAPLHSGKYFCVDSSNYYGSYEIRSKISANTTECPTY